MIRIARTTVVTALLAGALMLGFWKVTTDRQQRLIDELAQMNAELEELLGQRQAMIDRLSRSRRVAHIQVVSQTLDEHGEVETTDLVFIELDDEGGELDRQSFTVPGEVLFVDAWTVKFDAEHVAEGHPLFGRALILLRRIYSDRMAPVDGFPIDTPGAVPPGYAASEVATFEQQIWAHFWELATDPALADAMGVRVAQGEAVYKPIEAGRTYELTIDTVGGMSLVPLDERTTLSHADS